MPEDKRTTAEIIKDAEAQATTPVQEVQMPTTEGTYFIIRQKDGNYVGYTYKAGKLIDARQGDPQTVLTMLITHE